MKRFISLTVACGLLWFIGCEKHDHSHDDEHKVPGSFILYLISEGGDTLKATWQDPDGPGGNPRKYRLSIWRHATSTVISVGSWRSLLLMVIP